MEKEGLCAESAVNPSLGGWSQEDLTLGRLFSLFSVIPVLGMEVLISGFKGATVKTPETQKGLVNILQDIRELSIRGSGSRGLELACSRV